MTQSISQNNITSSDITTYGALILPYDLTIAKEQNKIQINAKIVTNFCGKLQSALKNSPQTIKNAITNPTQTFKNLADYMKDNRQEISGVMNTIGSKFSGIAVTQAIINGKVTSREALDYLFMGFAPALGIQGSLMGYSGLHEMKDAFSNGTINVGQFVNGFSKTLKGATDLKDMLSKKEPNQKGNILEFDLTLSHSESYQSETPDRRVQSGQTLNEFIHNMPITFEVQCALQEGKRYSKTEFRAILENLRKEKKTVSLILGDEIFDNLILTNFNPTHDCTKSGMDYTLSFKKITRSDVIADKEVIVQTKPATLDKDMQKTVSYGGLSRDTGSSKANTPKLPKIDDPKVSLFDDVAKQISNFANKTANKTKSLAAKVKDEWDKRNKK